MRPALERVESVLAGFDPRPHWGKVFLDRSPQEIADLYPELPRFRALRDAMDPDRRFGNAFVEGLFGSDDARSGRGQHEDGHHQRGQAVDGRLHVLAQ